MSMSIVETIKRLFLVSLYYRERKISGCCCVVLCFFFLEFTESGLTHQQSIYATSWLAGIVVFWLGKLHFCPCNLPKFHFNLYSLKFINTILLCSRKFRYCTKPLKSPFLWGFGGFYFFKGFEREKKIKQKYEQKWAFFNNCWYKMGKFATS
jgi:hypothetical protein